MTRDEVISARDLADQTLRTYCKTAEEDAAIMQMPTRLAINQLIATWTGNVLLCELLLIAHRDLQMKLGLD